MQQENLPDECWKAQYKNDSRKWITHNESALSPCDIYSSMREHYQSPLIHKTERRDKAIRRQLFKDKLIIEMTEEIEREKAISDDIADYCTTYDEKFRIPGFKVNDTIPEDTELHKKYPLYHSAPITIWSKKLEKSSDLAGMTRIGDPLNPFKKNDSFTTPVYERFCESEI